MAMLALTTMSAMASGRRLLAGMLVLFVCDVIGGFLAVVSGIATWGEAWGFDTTFTVPLPVALLQLVLAWLAARNVRPPVGLVAAVVLGVFCLVSLLFGLFDGDLTNKVASAGYPGGIAWGIVLLAVTALVGVLAVAQARQLSSIGDKNPTPKRS
jgi:hypothetical protein